jgi:hypothetical protein
MAQSGIGGSLGNMEGPCRGYAGSGWYGLSKSKAEGGKCGQIVPHAPA